VVAKASAHSHGWPTGAAVASPYAESARGGRQRSGGVEKYSSIASRQAPEHGSAASSPGLDSRISAAIFSAQLMQTPAHPAPAGGVLLAPGLICALDLLWFELAPARPALSFMSAVRVALQVGGPPGSVPSHGPKGCPD
jgi:hypothetical protein